MQKKCIKCQLVKDVSEFHKNSSKEDGLQTRCKPCNSASTIFKYKNNEDFRLKVNESAKNRREILRDEVNKIKANLGCSNCSEKDIRCLDFHHIDAETKVASISNLLSIKNREKIFNEIKKCIVLCSNCHRKLHN